MSDIIKISDRGPRKTIGNSNLLLIERLPMQVYANPKCVTAALRFAYEIAVERARSRSHLSSKSPEGPQAQT